MGRMVTAIVVVVGWLLAPGYASAQATPAAPTVDLTGTWIGEIKTPVSYSPIQISFKLEQTSKGVTGVAWPGSAEVPIRNVAREGNRLSFEISGEGVVYRFALAATSERLEGDTSADDHGHTWTGKATLKREKEEKKTK